MTGSRRFLWLGLGVALLLVANGRWLFPPASWVFSVGWLVFLDSSKRLRGLLTALAAWTLVYFVLWVGIIPVPGALYYLIAATYAVVYFLPFVCHRLLAARFDDLRATLVFPLAWVAVELVFTRWLTPYGSWTSLAYTQSDVLTLVQLASVTGTGGLVFMMTWLAAVVAWILRPGRERRRWTRGAVAYALALSAVLVFGQLRLLERGTGPGIRVAGLAPSSAALAEIGRAVRPALRGEELSAEALATMEAAAARLNDDLLERTRREARAGALLVAWSETAGRVFAADEPALLARAGRLAAEEGVTLLLSLGVWHPDRTPPFANKVVAITDSGAVAWEFHKAHPIIGAESPFVARGDGVVDRLDASFGSVGAVICHDLDFPALVRRASAAGIGLLVAPSDDWKEITVLHARMAAFRAVENGLTLFRPTNGGRSLVVDPRGRVTARLDFISDAFVAHLAADRASTIYGRVGDLFSWLCLAALVALSASGLRIGAVRQGRRTDNPGRDRRREPVVRWHLT